MTVPMCPVHNVPMRKSNRGDGFFCSQKTGNDYCKEKWNPPVTPVASGAPSPSGEILASAALIYAALLHGKTDPDFHDEVFKTAMKAHDEMRKRL